eukprot:1186944-Prorocentrum_minimum.AAC.3
MFQPRRISGLSWSASRLQNREVKPDVQLCNFSRLARFTADRKGEGKSFPLDGRGALRIFDTDDSYSEARMNMCGVDVAYPGSSPRASAPQRQSPPAHGTGASSGVRVYELGGQESNGLQPNEAWGVHTHQLMAPTPSQALVSIGTMGNGSFGNESVGCVPFAASNHWEMSRSAAMGNGCQPGQMPNQGIVCNRCCSPVVHL